MALTDQHTQCEHTAHLTHVHTQVHCTYNRVQESPAGPTIGLTAHNPHRHVSCIIDTYPVYAYHMYHIHLLCTCHSHMAGVHSFLNLCPHITHPQHVSLRYLFLCLPHIGSLGGLGQPLWVGLRGWRSERQGLDLHRRGEKVAPGFTAGGQEIIVDTKPSGPFAGQVIRPLPDSA